MTTTRVQPVVGVIGLGQIGGSMARALQASGHVLGFDIDAQTNRAAAAAGIAVAPDVCTLVQRSAVIALAVPLHAYPAVASALSQCASTDRLLFDVGSSSEPLSRLARALGRPARFRFVGSHPMAGTERQGFVASDGTLFDGCTWAVLCDAHVDAIDVLQVAMLTLRLGARPVICERQAHDNAVARVSHLPHLLAMALTLTGLEGSERRLHAQMAAGSFRDGTRVAASDTALVASMCIMNARALRQALDDCRKHLDLAERALGESNARLFDMFSQALAARESLPAEGKGSRTTQTLAARSADELIAALLALGQEGRRLCAITPPGNGASDPEWSAVVELP